jgi:hypothetical protein
MELGFPVSLAAKMKVSCFPPIRLLTVGPFRIPTVSLSRSCPAGSDSPEGRAQNRRIQITVQKQPAAAFYP